jgi:hypothetical protein
LGIREFASINRVSGEGTNTQSLRLGFGDQIPDLVASLGAGLHKQPQNGPTLRAQRFNAAVNPV